MVHAEAVSRALSLAELAAPRPERARRTSRMRQRRRSRTCCSARQRRRSSGCVTTDRCQERGQRFERKSSGVEEVARRCGLRPRAIDNLTQLSARRLKFLSVAGRSSLNAALLIPAIRDTLEFRKKFALGIARHHCSLWPRRCLRCDGDVSETRHRRTEVA